MLRHPYLPALALIAPQRLRAPDLAIVAFYLVAITLFGLRFRDKNKGGKPDRSLRSYFLAGNTIPWWAISLSVVSAETSTLTIISIPGVAFAGNFGFLQVVLGYLVGRVVVAALFLPRYFAGDMLTAYQLIDRRFGPFLHKVTAGLFLLTRAAAEGVRVFAVSIVVGIAIGTGDVLSIAIISALTLLYTFEGGMTAVIWTDVVQMAVYVGGTVVALLTLGHHIPGGWPTIVQTAGAAGKFGMFNFALNLTQSYTFWAGLLGGTFLTMASHGTDQLMVQRLLAARNLRESQLALLSSGVVIFMQFAFFLLIGAGLWVFYGPVHNPVPWALHPVPSFRSNDYIFPTFIAREMPVGIAGLLVAAILAAAMSNLSAALNSLSSTTVVDFYMQARPAATDRERTLVSKSSTALWALVLFAVAVYSIRVGGKGHVVEIGLSIAAVAYGCLLGVFLLGTLTKFANEYGTAVGMLCGFALNLWLWQGHFPVRLGPLTIPHIAFTWYVLIGAAATFAIGSLASLVFRKGSRPERRTTATAALLLFLLSFPQGTCLSSAAAQIPSVTLTVSSRPKLTYVSGVERPLYSAMPNPPQKPQAQHGSPTTPAQPDFTPISALITDAIAQGKLPGAVVVIGHNGRIAFEHAYGVRKLAGEPGLDGQPSPVEPMTEDTIFDMASLTKCIVTATAIGQLYEAGKLDFDTPLDHYLPDFNPTHDPQRSQVTLRLLLTHFSGEPPDVNLKDPWGLAAPDRAEGLRRALTTPLAGTPGTKFVYSDINFILLGALVETLSGQHLDTYARGRIFIPLGMAETRYHSFEKVCAPTNHLGANTIAPPKSGTGRPIGHCTAPDFWTPADDRVAPTAHDDEGTPATNPDYNHLLRGTVHDPTTRRMGGVAGHAGVFSTAHDMSLFAQALLDKLTRNTGPFPLEQSTLQLMTTPEQPGHNPAQLANANAAEQAKMTPRAGNDASSRPEATGRSGETPASAPAHVQGQAAAPAIPDPLLAPNYPALKGQTLRGFGWDIDSGYSKPRGRLFPIGSFGHTGFTGTSLWLDPASDTYVLLLANAIHPHPGQPISNLRGEVATAAAMALNLYHSTTLSSRPERSALERPAGLVNNAPEVSSRPERSAVERPAALVNNAPKVSSRPEAEGRSGETPVFAPAHAETGTPSPPSRDASLIKASSEPPIPFPLPPIPSRLSSRSKAEGPAFQPGSPQKGKESPPTLTGLDVLEFTHFAALAALTHPNHELRVGLLTNQTGLDSHNRRTVDILATDLPKAVPNAKLTTLFSPEHGIFGRQDTEHLNAETDPTTGLQVTSLYGAHETDRRPSHEQLKDLDAVLIDLQDAGVRCYTYETVLGYFLEASATEKRDHNHDLEIIVLDRPNPIGGEQIGGPVSDPGTESYINYMPLPLRHGLTFGELARYINNTEQLGVHLTVVPLQNWRRSESFDETGLPWVNPSPNLRSTTAESIYPATAFLELTNLSVGRGTSTPFEVFGAGSDSTSGSWFHGAAVATALTARSIPGVRFEATTVPVADDTNRYPFHGQTIEAVRVIVTDRSRLDTSELGLELLSTVHRLYPTHFQLEKAMRLVASRSTLDRLARGDDPRRIAADWQPDLDRFRETRKSALLY